MSNTPGELILYSPHPCHEQPINDLVNDLVLNLSSLQYNREHANLNVDTNNILVREDLHTVPDLQVHLLLFSAGLQALTECLWIGESGFSQSRASIVQKMKKAIEKEPGILFTVIILVKERSPYHTPKADSDTAKVLRTHPYRNEIEFLPSMLNLIKLAPVAVEGHIWVDIEAVEWHVWLRGASPIDFDKTPTNFFAKGTLFPSINMSSVDALLARGLAAVCNRLLSQMQNIWLNNDHAALAAWSPATGTNWRGVPDVVSIKHPGPRLHWVAAGEEYGFREPIDGPEGEHNRAHTKSGAVRAGSALDEVCHFQAEEPNIPRSGYDRNDEPLEGYKGDVLQDDPEEAFYLPSRQPQERSNMELENNGYDEEFDDGACSQQDRCINWDDHNDMQSDSLDLVVHPDGKVFSFSRKHRALHSPEHDGDGDLGSQVISHTPRPSSQSHKCQSPSSDEFPDHISQLPFNHPTHSQGKSRPIQAPPLSAKSQITTRPATAASTKLISNHPKPSWVCTMLNALLKRANVPPKLANTIPKPSNVPAKSGQQKAPRLLTKDILFEHHQRNGVPRAPDPARLDAVHSQSSGKQQAARSLRQDSNTHITQSHFENEGGYESGSEGGDGEDQGEEDVMDYSCAYKPAMKLKFYPPMWKKVLHIACMYCHFVTTVNRFPDCMDIVEDEFGAEILLQSIMYSDLGDLWLAVKKVARGALTETFDIKPVNALTEEDALAHVKSRYTQLHENSRLFHNFRDDGTVENFGSTALTQTCVRAFYDGKMSLAPVFPEKFGRILPGGAHVFGATMLALALDEYADGYFQRKQVKSDDFETIYDKLCDLFDKVEDSRHYDVLEARHKQIAMLGCSHNPKAKPQKTQFQVFL
ncbi:hypothetical protein EDD15DRAFT_2358096 [Pisolithus albus]|nr:hypothetical protein EDD15DRAFT_2358096 [Pisolithus albus]